MNRYGGIEGYLRQVIGLTDDDFAALRDTYLEPVAEQQEPVVDALTNAA